MSKPTNNGRGSVPRQIRQLFPSVTRCVDATEPVEISVTKKDCASGEKLSADECAMARAARRQMHADGACIGMSYSYIVSGTTAVRYATPASVAREITSFDRHGDFAPGEYLLSAIVPSQRLGRRHKRKHSGPKNAKRIVHNETVRVRTMR